ncbi:MAG: BrnT family toxin [Chloroflexi bacterium]|nr:BrnT family toxin [Chloroflexota bacterium]
MIINQLIWDDGNVEHIARHDVSPKEIEDICFGFHISVREHGQRSILSGRTAAGRYLNVVVERVSKEVFRPVTAFEMSAAYKRRYRKRLGDRR